jgi:hypothetical protein
MAPVHSHREAWSLSGVSASATGSAIDLRASNGHFYRYVSGSANGPTAGGSSIIDLRHSHDLTAWMVLETLTAVKGTQYSAWHSAGVYAYIRADVRLAYSAAQTGTGVTYCWIQPGVH